jgi:hypothetical protein
MKGFTAVSRWFIAGGTRDRETARIRFWRDYVPDITPRAGQMLAGNYRRGHPQPRKLDTDPEAARDCGRSGAWRESRCLSRHVSGDISLVNGHRMIIGSAIFAM